MVFGSWPRVVLCAVLLLVLPLLLTVYRPIGTVNVTGILQAGRIQEQNLELLAAERTYQEGLRKLPHHIDLLKALATLYAASFRFREATAVAAEMEAYHKGELSSWPQSLIRAFDPYYQPGYANALQALQNSIQRHPHEALLPIQLADLAINYYTHEGRRPEDRDKIETALSWLQRARVLDRPGADYYFVAGETSMARGDFNSAHALYDKALAAGNWSDPWLQREALMAAGFMALHQGNLDGARRQLAQCLEGLSHWENYHAARSKPFREMILATLHVYFSSPIPLDQLRGYQLEYQKMDVNKVQGPLNQVRGQVLQMYSFVTAGRLDEALLTSQDLSHWLGDMAACPTALLVFRHWNCVLLVELGDAAFNRQRYKDASTYYRKAMSLFPQDKLILKRLEKIKPLMNNAG